MQKQLKFVFVSALLLSAVFTGSANAQTTAFTYQGKLTDSGAVANATYDMQFKLFDAVANGNQVGATLTNATVPVANGIFMLPLDFGAAAFPGADRFVEVSVRLAGTGAAYTTLTPRQQVTSTPYAVQALNAMNATTAGNLTTAGSANFIQNSTTQQTTSNFNISGDGRIGGALTANSVNAITQFNLGDVRILSNAGTNNLFVGTNAGAANTTQTDNTFVGAGAGQHNGTGDTKNLALRNTFVGSNAGNSNTTGQANSFFGAEAGEANLTGVDNSFFGSVAGRSNTTGESNSFFGAAAGLMNTVGFGNTFFGNGAGANTTQGNNNSFFGAGAGNNNTTGSNNTLIGEDADVPASSNLNFATAIGAGAFVTASNSIVLGRTTGSTFDNVGIGTPAPSFKLHVVDAGNVALRVQTDTAGGTVASFGGNGDFQVDAANVPGGRFIVLQNGNVGIGTATPQAKLDVNGIIRVASFGTAGSTQLCVNSLNQIASCGSSLRYKTRIAPFATGLQLIKQLQPITFDWKQSGRHDVGFGAEDVARLNPLFVTYKDGQVEGVKYDRFSTLFVNAFKEQAAQIEAQQQFINTQESEIDQQQTTIDTQYAQTAASTHQLQTQLESQQIQLVRQQRMIQDLRTLACQRNAQASVCRKKRSNSALRRD
jgi:hypothetical protein